MLLLVRLEHTECLKVPRRAQVSTIDSVELASIQSRELKDPKSFNCKKENWKQNLREKVQLQENYFQYFKLRICDMCFIVS